MVDGFKSLEDLIGDVALPPSFRSPVIASEESKLLCLTRPRGCWGGDIAIIEPRDPFPTLDERGTRGGDADPRGEPHAGLGGGLTHAPLPTAGCVTFEFRVGWDG